MSRALLGLLLAAMNWSPAVAQHPGGRHEQVEEHRLWVEVQGTRGPWLLLIGGGPGGSHDYFHPYMDDLAKDHRVVFFDAFGTGKSDRVQPGGRYSFDQDVRDLEALRSRLGVSSWAVLGHSYGGFVAQEYALRHPDRVDHLIVSNSFVSPGTDLQEATDNLNGSIGTYLPEVAERVRKLRDQGKLANDPQLQEATFGSIGTIMSMFYFYDPAKAGAISFSESSFNPEVYYGIMGPDADFVIGGDVKQLDFAPRLARLSTPLLVIGGRADGIASPRWVARFRGAAPKARVVTLETSGHFPFIEQTGDYLKLIRDFIAEKPGT